MWECRIILLIFQRLLMHNLQIITNDRKLLQIIIIQNDGRNLSEYDLLKTVIYFCLEYSNASSVGYKRRVNLG